MDVTRDQSSLSDSTPGVATPGTESDAQIEQISIPWTTISRGLDGVAVATKAADGDVERISSTIRTALNDRDTLSLRDWYATITEAGLEDSLRHRANLSIAVAFLIHSGRESISISAADLDFVWSLVREALATTSIPYTVSRTSQGNLTVPLWSLINDGNIDELFRLHVWLPDGQRGNIDLAIHAHQPFVQSWILAGQGRDHVYEVESANASTATHAEFSVGWSNSSGQDTDKAYKIHSKSSTVSNTGNLLRVISETTELHSRNMTYTVPAGVCHRSEVAPDTLHATLFFFDSRRGFEQNAPVLGPVDTAHYTQQRDSTDVTAAKLVTVVESMRAWEAFYEEGLRHVREARWEEGLRALRSALRFCESTPDSKHAPRYQYAALGEIGHIYRMLGRYELASATLEDVLRDMPPTQQRAELTGELAVVYRHMNRLEDAKRACEDEYNIAKLLNQEKDMCRAVGNLGMVNYQLFLESQDVSLLDLAMSQLNERIEIARRLKVVAITQLSDPDLKAQLIHYASQREAIALGRLSLCFMQKGDSDQAMSTALEALNLQFTQDDPTKIAFARCFYGRALLFAGRAEEAEEQFNPYNTCTPTIALCKEPSDEHREYIREMIEAGADMELRDEQGYSALECAVYCGDTATQKVVEEGLRLKFIRKAARAYIGSRGDSATSRMSEGSLRLEFLLLAEEKLERLRYEAYLRKGYRELFQDTLRPVLLRANNSSSLNELRIAYANALKKDSEKKRIFDGLKVVRYADFVRCGKIPRSSDGFTTELTSGPDGKSGGEFIVFFSYRWIAHDRGAQPAGDSPDDIYHTQYRRMLRALDKFLELHPDLDRENLCIWIDFACVNQEDADHQQPGVAALPMNLAQCNAMISLIDDQYYERSWCCIEVMMIQTLQKAYGLHLWYEHVIDPVGGAELLREGPKDLEISMAQKRVTYEADRPNLMFLERQTKLLG